MKNRIFWSVGLYSVDIVVACGDVPDICFPTDFTEGVVSRHIKKKYDYDSRIDNNVFRIYMGINSRNMAYLKETMQEIATRCGYSQTMINNIEDLTIGGKSIIDVTEEMYDL